jgi:anti-sigma factor RsiW
MNEELQIKVQALLDGELPEAGAREVLSLIARDPDAAALHTELKNTRQALAKYDRHVLVPEFREFYWSKIQREIERLEPVRPARRSWPVWAWLRRSLIPATALCAVVVAILVLLPSGARGPEAEQRTAMTDTGALTYRDYASGTTLVWLSFPAETPN